MTTKSSDFLSDLNNNTGQLVINRLPGVSFKCVRWSIPGFSFNPAEVDIPQQPFYIPGSKFRSDPFVATFLVDEDLTNWLSVVSWMFKLRSYDGPNITEELDDFSFILLDNQGRPNAGFRYSLAFPQGVDPLEGTSATNNVEKMTSTITMRYQNVEIDVYSGEDRSIIKTINAAIDN